MLSLQDTRVIRKCTSQLGYPSAERKQYITRRGVPLPREKRYNTIGVFLQLIYGQQGWSHPG